MHKINVPYKNFNDQPRNKTVHFNLTQPEMFKLLNELATIQAIYDQMEVNGDQRELTPSEAVDFYTAFEEIILAAYGVPSADGEYFRKDGVYDFKESAILPAVTMIFVHDPTKIAEFMQKTLPAGMADDLRDPTKLEEMRAKAALEAQSFSPQVVSTEPKTPEEVQAQIDLLKAQLSND